MSPPQRERSSQTGDIAGTRSQTTLIETRIGTDTNAPGTPLQVREINETKMTTGFSVNRRRVTQACAPCDEWFHHETDNPAISTGCFSASKPMCIRACGEKVFVSLNTNAFRSSCWPT